MNQPPKPGSVTPLPTPILTDTTFSVNDLRNPYAYPTFSSIPLDYGHNPAYYRKLELPHGTTSDMPIERDDGVLVIHNVDGGDVWSPFRHWCLLAEIVDMEWFLRLQLTLRDKHGAIFQLAFYTDRKGREVYRNLKVGYTVAILYGHKHEFQRGELGIQMNYLGWMKVIPYSLDELLGLNDRLHATIRCGRTQDFATCHGCGRQAPDLKKCSSCFMFHYCSKDCQKNGWKYRGHSRDCSMLRDPDIREIFTAYMDKFQDFMYFPGPI